jgi:argininosuccinate lyase
MRNVFLTAAMLLAAAPALAAEAPTERHDPFYWMGEINKASLVMTVETGIVPRALGAKTAAAVAQVIENGAKPGGPRPEDYLQLEPLIVAIAGPDATRMHSGRSRQDIIPTVLKLEQRERLLALVAALDTSRGKLIELAGRYPDVIVPGYTNGVQAQPTTLGHYLLGYAGALGRDADRLREAFARVNQSPLGAAALGTSSFPVDRPRLATLLGFDGPVENSYDSGQLAPMDIGLELAGIATNLATTIGSFADDIYAQYHQTQPWMLLREGALTGPSSIMPQKRNPVALYMVRMQASDVVGAAQAFTIMAHNVESGMPDYKRNQLAPPAKTLDLSIELLHRLDRVLDGLVVDPERAAAEVDNDYSTTTELADTLQREADVPFRLGHHFASELVSFGRSNHLRPAEIGFDDVKRIYAASAQSTGMATAFPLTEARFREALSARGMVNAAKGLGGPQPAEVTRMLGTARQRLTADQAWLDATRAKVTKAQADLQIAFQHLDAAQ